MGLVVRSGDWMTAAVSTDGQSSAIQQGLGGSANKKRRKYFDNKESESDTQTQWDGCKEDQYWTVWKKFWRLQLLANISC